MVIGQWAMGSGNGQWNEKSRTRRKFLIPNSLFSIPYSGSQFSEVQSGTHPRKRGWVAKPGRGDRVLHPAGEVLYFLFPIFYSLCPLPSALCVPCPLPNSQWHIVYFAEKLLSPISRHELTQSNSICYFVFSRCNGGTCIDLLV
jgi:hypothetical protein